jgi:hypothetical protein
MKNRLARAITMVVAGSALALAGAGAATAGTMDGGGNGSSSTQSAAAQVQQARDDLAGSANAGDVKGTQAGLAKLDSLLTDLAEGQKYKIQATASETVATAQDQATEAAKAVAAIPVDSGARAELPPVAGLLNALLQRVLLSLSVLVNDLLGGLTLP